MPEDGKAVPVISSVGPVVRWAPNVKPDSLSHYTLEVVRSIMIAARCPSLMVTSTQRSPFQQARAMYNNILALGVEKMNSLYLESGREVVGVYTEHMRENSETIIAAMTRKIIEIGPERVSHHCVTDPHKINVLDIAPSTIASSHDEFIAAVLADHRVSKFLQPPRDPAYHLEVPQPQSPAPSPHPSPEDFPAA